MVNVLPRLNAKNYLNAKAKKGGLARAASFSARANFTRRYLGGVVELGVLELSLVLTLM